MFSNRLFLFAGQLAAWSTIETRANLLLSSVTLTVTSPSGLASNQDGKVTFTCGPG